ncbi:MAG: RNA polymerase sigma factor [Planctomycetota bacterium]
MTALCPISLHVSLNVQSGEIASVDVPEPGSVVALVGRANTGDRQAAAALLRLMQDRWYRYCLAQLRRPDEADDATQEVALRVLRGLGRLREAGRFETWSFGVALNVCREARRRAIRHRSSELEGHEPTHTPELPEDHARLRAALGGLPPRQREAVTLRYLEGLTIEQTAEAMRCRQGTVKAAVHKGLKSMRRLMAEGER